MEQYTSDSSDSDSREAKTLDYGRLKLSTDYVEDNMLGLYRTDAIETIFLNHNLLTSVPVSIVKFTNLRVLDLSSNSLTALPDILSKCPLTTLIAKNNLLTNDSLPKCFGAKTGAMREINLSGNQLTHFPDHVLDLKGLRFLYLGGNQIPSISKDIWKLQK